MQLFMILVVLDCIKFKLFVMLLCHNEILLQHVSIVPCLYIFGTSHFDLYYLYSSTIYIFAWCKSPIRCKLLGTGETFKIANFYKSR